MDEIQKIKKESGRNISLDLLRIIAAVFVILLHIDGFIGLSNDITSFTPAMKFLYRMIESCTYSAIHIFVFISSYYLIRTKFSIKRVIVLWLNTFLVTATGLVIITLVAPNSITLKNIVQCVIPFTGQAYWFVSAYALLVLFSPFMNKLISILNDKQLFFITSILFAMTIIKPSFIVMYSDHVGGVSNIALFVVIYFVCALISRYENKINKWGGMIYLSCVALLVLSTYLLEYIVPSISEWAFFSYNSILVICSGGGLFMYFLKKKINISSRREHLVTLLSRNTLFVYMIHMHPIAKECYIQWGWLEWLNTSSVILYILQAVLLVIVIYVLGVLIGTVISHITKKIMGMIEMVNIYERIKKCIEVI